MSLVDRIKDALTVEEVDVYECSDCGWTFEADPADPSPTCPDCGSTLAEKVTRKTV